MAQETLAQDAAVEKADKSLLESIFRTVSLIHACDERLQLGMRGGDFATMFYPIRGQEMIPAGVVAALNPDDYMVTTYRCLHDVVAKSDNLREIMAELLGRATGTSKGKGGPMHLADPRSGMMMTTGIVGAGLPVANGLALAAKMKGTGQVVTVSFGDGSTSIGAVHEALNLATVWDLPVIFVLQNNQYGEHTAIEGYTKTTRFSDRAAGYGMRGVTINGNDPLEVFDAVTEAAAKARAGEGPTFIECVTYRLEGHTYGSGTGYMDKAALAAAWDADPIPQYRNRLVASGKFDEAELAKIDEETRAQADDAVKFAMASERPSLDELTTDVFADVKDVLL